MAAFFQKEIPSPRSPLLWLLLVPAVRCSAEPGAAEPGTALRPGKCPCARQCHLLVAPVASVAPVGCTLQSVALNGTLHQKKQHSHGMSPAARAPPPPPRPREKCRGHRQLWRAQAGWQAGMTALAVAGGIIIIGGATRGGIDSGQRWASARQTAPGRRGGRRCRSLWAWGGAAGAIPPQEPGRRAAPAQPAISTRHLNPPWL